MKIGEKLVCSSHYQEIGKLMLNLPMTLSLEVKRPFSGKAWDLLSNYFFYVLSRLLCGSFCDYC